MQEAVKPTTVSGLECCELLKKMVYRMQGLVPNEDGVKSIVNALGWRERVGIRYLI